MAGLSLAAFPGAGRRQDSSPRSLRSASTSRSTAGDLSPGRAKRRGSGRWRRRGLGQVREDGAGRLTALALVVGDHPLGEPHDLAELLLCEPPGLPEGDESLPEPFQLPVLHARPRSAVGGPGRSIGAHPVVVVLSLRHGILEGSGPNG